MRILALSLNEFTADFRTACDALRFSGHAVDAVHQRPFGESNQGYNAGFFSLGDFTADDATRIKLSLVRAAIELPTVYFLDHAPPPQQPVEFFWRSALFDETATAMLHRAEMHRAMRSDWKDRIEAKLATWTPWMEGIRPSVDWDPEAFRDTLTINRREESAVKLRDLFAARMHAGAVR